MGGEKLNTAYAFWAAAFAFFLSITPLSAQSDQTPDAPVTEAARLPAEESFVFGEGTPAAGEGTASVWIVLRMVLVLALAALAIYGVVFFIKRLAKPPEIRDPHLKVLSSVPLGSASFAAVISVGSKAWLVGGGDSGVSLIAEIDEPEALETMLIDDARKTQEGQTGRFPDFRSLLRKLGASGAKNPNNSAFSGNFGSPFNSHTENLRKQQDRLRGL